MKNLTNDIFLLIGPMGIWIPNLAVQGIKCIVTRFHTNQTMTYS